MNARNPFPLLCIVVTTLLLPGSARSDAGDDLARTDYELAVEQYRIVSMKIFETSLQMDFQPENEALANQMHRLVDRKARLRQAIIEREGHLETRNTATAVQLSATIPDGNYIVKLRLSRNGGQDAIANYQVVGGRGRIVAATQSALINATGEFQPIAFRSSFRNDGFGSSQIWKPRGDGSFQVLEIPDRGENQIAVPVDGPTLAWPETATGTKEKP